MDQEYTYHTEETMNRVGETAEGAGETTQRTRTAEEGKETSPGGSAGREGAGYGGAGHTGREGVGYSGAGRFGGAHGGEFGKPKKKVPGWVRICCLGLAFGLVAGTTFQAASFATAKILGIHQSARSAKTAKPVANTTLTSSKGGAVNSNIADIAGKMMPSVVSITNMSVQQVRDFFGGVREQKSTAVGSGIIVGQNDKELLIVTNNHVIEGSENLTVSFIDEESVEANVKGADASRDLAVVAVDLSKIKDSTMKKIAVATMGDSSKLQVGETAIAIGNALGYGQSVTTGIVSALNRQLEGFDGKLIQTDAAINPGNSGGALINTKGEVIGINTVKVASNQVEGMGYAIPISDVKDIINNLMNQKTKARVAASERGYLGIQGMDVNEESAKMYNIPVGVYVSEVIEGSGAQKAGIEKGMIVTALEGSAVSDMKTLKEQLQYYKVGDTVKITVKVQKKDGGYTEKEMSVVLSGQN